MRLWMVLMAGLMGCQSDAGFSKTVNEPGNVEGAGMLSYSPDKLEWEDLTIGITTGRTLTISSIGELNLVIKQARLTNTGGGVFYMEEVENRTVAPGNDTEIVVIANLTEATPATGQMQIKTNASDYIDFSIELEAWPMGSGGDDTGDTGGDTGTDDTGGADDTGDTDTGDTDSGGTDSGGTDTDTGGTDTGSGSDSGSGGE